MFIRLYLLFCKFGMILTWIVYYLYDSSPPLANSKTVCSYPKVVI